MHHTRYPLIGLAIVLVLSVSSGAQTPVGTAFTYQGKLDDAGSPANGIYDLEFALYDAATAGSQVGSTVSREDVAVAAGLFVVALDFGSAAFTGSARWLQIGVRPGASTDPFTPLTSRQELTPTPNAIFSAYAETSSDVSCSGCLSESDLDFDPATQSELNLHKTSGDHDARFVLKAGDTMTGTLTLSPVSGAGLSTTADIDLQGRVMRGTTSFIHASTSLYSTAIGESALDANTGSANTAAGYESLLSNTVGYSNTATGFRALSSNTEGSGNTATGIRALYLNTVGESNTATGVNALYSNTVGLSNVATGTNALYNNINGASNIATGSGALYSNIGGGNNTAVGGAALTFNTEGDLNTAIGTNALFSNTTGSNNIAVGSLAGYNATTGDYNIYIGNQGVADEANTIRIGTNGTHTSLFAAGVTDVPVSFASLVGVTNSGQLGTVPTANPALGQVLKWSGTEWAPSNDDDSGGTVTSITAGTGLTGGTITSSGTIGVDFGSSATTVAAGDHDHFGQIWSGSGDGLEVTTTSGTGIVGSGPLYGVYGLTDSTAGTAIAAISSASSGYTTGVYSETNSPSGISIYGVAYATSGGGIGVYGDTYSTSGYGGYFVGRVHVEGTLSKGGGGFKIDHPLDPGNKYLYHSFVESPDMMNIYNGNVTTDASGYATIEMPEWFGSLNRDFRYQLTVIDVADVDAFVQAKIIREIENNRFTIRTSMPRTKVSWQVTGVRKDAWAEAHRIPVEEDKSGEEQGTYLYPEAVGQPKEMSLDYRLHPPKIERPDHHRGDM